MNDKTSQRIFVNQAIVIGVLGVLAWLTGGNSTANISFAQVLERVEKSQIQMEKC